MARTAYRCYAEAMPAKPPSEKPVNEDRRRPKAIVPYAVLWGLAVGGLVFALVVMWATGA